MSNTLCEKLISSAITIECENMQFAGVEQKAWIGNKSHIESIEYETLGSGDDITQRKYIVRKINMKPGTGLYPIQQLGNQAYAGTSTAFVAGTYYNKFTHTVQFANLNNDDESAELNTNLANGTVFMILENSYKGGNDNGQFQVYGIEKGLKMSALQQDKYSDDLEGGAQITLVEENIPYEAQFLVYVPEEGDTITSTKAYIESLEVV